LSITPRGIPTRSGTQSDNYITMPRIPETAIANTEDRVRRDLEAQAKKWGAPLTPSLVYARNPGLYVAIRGMWKALASSDKIDPGLGGLINRRVAALNGCVF
jgi:alkylhydroperoxidase family enzyme